MLISPGRRNVQDIFSWPSAFSPTRWPSRVSCLVLPGGADLPKELLVGGDGLVEQQLKGVLGIQRGERAAQAEDGGVFGGFHQQVFAASPGRHRVDRREHPLL